MAKITIFKYVCENNPNKAIDVVKSITPKAPRTGYEAEKCMIEIMRRGSDTHKQQLLAGLIEIHPDIDLFWEAQQYLQSEYKEEPEIHAPLKTAEQEIKMACTGNGGCSCGKMKATGIDDATIALEAKIEKLQTQSSTEKMISDKMFKIIIGACIIGFAYYLFVKKAP